MKLRSSQLCRRSTQWTVNHTTRHLTLAPAMHCACFCDLFSGAVCKTQWPCAVWSGWCTKVKIGVLPLHLKSWPMQHTAGFSPAYSVQNAVGSMQSEECNPLNLKSDCSRRWMMKSKSSQLREMSTQWTVNHTTQHYNPDISSTQRLEPAYSVQYAVGSK